MVGIKRLISPILLENGGFESLQKGRLFYVRAGIMNKSTRFHISSGVDM
jgi:hypothetical protein